MAAVESSKRPQGVSHPVALAALLSGLAMFGPFAVDAFFPAFHTLARELSASPGQMQQTISFYLLGYAMMALLYGPLSDAFGRRPVILGGILGFVLTSVGCALASSIEGLLFARFLQGCSTGAGMIVGRALVRDRYQGPEAQRVMALVSMFFGLGPALAPVLGGLMFLAFGWQAVFLFLAVYGLLLGGLAWRLLPETHPPAARQSVRVSALARSYTSIITDRPFLLLVAATGGNFAGQFLYISSAPRYIEVFLGLGSLGYAWFFVPMIVGMVIGSYLSSRLAFRVSPAVCANLGYRVMAAATALNLSYNLIDRTPSVPWAVIPNLLYALGVALAFPPINLLMLDRHPDRRGGASSVQAMAWGLMTALIAGVIALAVRASALHLAVGSAALFAVGWWCWWGYQRLAARAPVNAVSA